MFTHEHIALQDGVRQLIDKEINPYLDQWEEAEIFLPMKCSRSWARRDTWA